MSSLFVLDKNNWETK